MKNDFKNHIYEFKIKSNLSYSTGNDHYDIFRCIKCGYWLYRKFASNPTCYYWVIDNLFWNINFDNSNVLSCEKNIIKQLLE